MSFDREPESKPRFDEIGEPPGGEGESWREADRRLRKIAARRAVLDAEEAHWLLAARRAEVHRPFGYATFFEYVERRLGYRPHTARERIRVAEAMEKLPAIREALIGGRTSFTAIREITRIATPETEEEWLAAVQARTVREVETMVRGRSTGDRPNDPKDPDLEPRTLRLELKPDEYALFLQARRHLEGATGERLSDGDLVRAMCEATLGDGGAGSSPSCPELVLTVCELCETGQLDAAGQTLDVAPEAVESMRCDVEATKDVPRGTRRKVWRRDHGRCSVPGCRNARFLHVHHIVPRAEGGDHRASNLTLLCTAHHTAVHDGRLSIRGKAPSDLEFRHRDGKTYGAVSPPPIDLFAQAAMAMVGLGAMPLEAREAVARARSHVGPDSPAPVVITACLREYRSAQPRAGC